MKKLRIPPHAIDNLREREISLEQVRLTVENPERIVMGFDLRRIYMRRYHDSILGEQMLLRVVIEETEIDLVVVTAYKTSKIAKYMRE